MEIAVVALVGLGLAACASTGTAGGGGLPPIPEGHGRLFLETGGIPEVNFYVIDQETDEEVYSANPRMDASSPSRYERTSIRKPQYVDLEPGTYTVIVNTDIEDFVESTDVKVSMGEEAYVTVPVGRFQLIAFDERGRAQLPFLIYDYNMTTVLGDGMTSTEVNYFVVPVGTYKIRIENTSTGMDEHRPVEVTMGRIQNITVGSPPAPTTPDQPGEEQDQ